LLIIVYLLGIASDINRKKSTPLPLSRGELDLLHKMKERITPAPLKRGIGFVA